MGKLVAIARMIARTMGYIGAFAVVAMMLHISLDVVLRNLFRISMNTVPEIVARYYMTALAFLPLGWLELRRQMISVELIDFALSERVRQYSDALVMVVASVIYGFLAWTNWDKALSETRVGTLVEIATYKMPVWHSFYFAPIGFTLATVITALLAIGYLNPTLAAQLDEATE
ncbi:MULTISPECIES: TRAP transporter small permease [Maritimibacter]|jgi:TRAP-type C4-dicarboxylate transport system permease small subunit|uniref:TRAP transporter small permease n=1 Tax=Maritimibacter TaxID=404235 RepID=UPI001108F7D2|nr:MULTISPECIES: TRAP transporter small permease [Maritimibacter]MBL6427890.1 TRAP transporter small permease [Maritimibacter sp.]